MNEESKTYTHPSYGVIHASRVSCNKPTSLFGSNIKPTNYITLTISTAELERDLNNDFVYEKGRLIEINISEMQWASFVSSLNNGNTPCTLRYINNESIESPPFLSKFEQFDDEFSKRLSKLSDDVKEYISDIIDILQTKKNIGKADRQLIVNKLSSFSTELKNNMPYMIDQYIETTDNILRQAKQEVSSYIKSVNANKLLDSSSVAPELESKNEGK